MVNSEELNAKVKSEIQLIYIPDIQSYFPDYCRDEIDYLKKINEPIFFTETGYCFEGTALGFAILRGRKTNGHFFAEQQLDELVKILLEHGADSNIPEASLENNNIREVSSFMYAVRISPNEIIHLLLQHGANCFAKDNRGYTVLDWSIIVNPQGFNLARIHSSEPDLIPLDDEPLNDYRAFCSKKVKTDQLEPTSDGTLIIHNYSRMVQLQPLMANIVERLYKQCLDKLNELTKLLNDSMPNSMKDINLLVAKYAFTFDFSHVSFVLYNDKKLFSEIGQEFIQILFTAYNEHQAKYKQQMQLPNKILSIADALNLAFNSNELVHNKKDKDETKVESQKSEKTQTQNQSQASQSMLHQFNAELASMEEELSSLDLDLLKEQNNRYNYRHY